MHPQNHASVWDERLRDGPYGGDMRDRGADIRQTAIGRAFTEHPASVGETYTEHMRVAAHFAKELSLAAGAAAMHAIVPSMCCTSASDRVKRLYVEMTTGNRAPADAPVDAIADVAADLAPETDGVRDAA